MLFPLDFFVHEQSFLGAHSLDYCAVPGVSLVCVGSMCVARGFYLISFDSSPSSSSHARDVTGSTVHFSLGFIVWCLDLLWSVSDYVCGERTLPERYRKLSLFPHICN